MSKRILDKALPWASGLVPYQPGKPIAELQREQGLKDIIKLASNENPIGPSPKAIASLTTEFLNNMHYYPDGSGYELKEALSFYHSRKENEFILGNGSDQIFGFIVKSLVSPNDNIVVSEYGFAAYAIAAKSVGASVKFAPSREWGHDLQAMLEAVDEKTKVIFIANPNNPTGTWNNKTEFKGFMDKVPSDVLVVVDQAYFEYVKNEHDYPNAVEYIDAYDNLLVTFTYSKAFGLAGLRLGYGVANSEIIALLERFRLPFNINQAALAAGVAALQDEKHIMRSVDINDSGKKYLYQEFSNMGLEYISSMGNFVMVDLKRDTIPVFEDLQSRGIIVRPLKPYKLDTWLRVSIGLQKQNETLIKEMKGLLRG